MAQLSKSCEEEVITIGHCRGGSKEAFEVIVRRYMKDAYFIALGLVGNREDALDLSQEAFARAYYNIKRFNQTREFFPWFYQILRNLCFNHLRKRKRERNHRIKELGQQSSTTCSGDRFAPELIAERNEMKEKVWTAVGRLDDKHREVIILRHFQNLSYEQIARTLYCNKGTVTSRLYYARRKLKEILCREKGGQQE